MDLLKEAFIEGYKQRAESSNLIFDNASRMYAISLFDKWKSEQLLLHDVSQQRELLIAELKEWDLGYTSFNNLEEKLAEKLLKAINCG